MITARTKRYAYEIETLYKCGTPGVSGYLPLWRYAELFSYSIRILVRIIVDPKTRHFHQLNHFSAQTLVDQLLIIGYGEVFNAESWSVITSIVEEIWQLYGCGLIPVSLRFTSRKMVKFGQLLRCEPPRFGMVNVDPQAYILGICPIIVA